MKKSLLSGNIIPNILMLFLGLILLTPSYKIYSYCLFNVKAVSVYGIVDKTPAGGGAGFGAKPLVQYKDLQGKVHVIKSKAKTHLITAPKKGEKIKVLFLEDNPQTAIVDSLRHHVFLPLIFITIGATIIFFALKNCWYQITVSK